jgi:DNA ligase D-like protein (predicted ligase)
MSRVTVPLRFIEPQLPSLVDVPPEGKHWIHEIKHDGYRTQVVIDRGDVRVFTRNGHDWSERYTSIIRAASQLDCRSGIIDGEAVVQDSNGVSDFARLQSAIRSRSQNIVLYAFDLLHLDGHDIRHRPLIERRSLLEHLIGADAESRIQFSEEFTGDGAAFFKACADTDLEGMVSKQIVAPYRSGRTKTWPKCKCFTESTFVVIGTDRDSKTGAMRALLAHDDGIGLIMPGLHSLRLAARKGKIF